MDPIDFACKKWRAARNCIHLPNGPCHGQFSQKYHKSFSKNWKIWITILRTKEVSPTPSKTVSAWMTETLAQALLVWSISSIKESWTWKSSTKEHLNKNHAMPLAHSTSTLAPTFWWNLSLLLTKDQLEMKKLIKAPALTQIQLPPPWTKTWKEISINAVVFTVVKD